MIQVFCCHCLNYRWQPLHGYRNSPHLLEHSHAEITWSQSTMYLCVLQAAEKMNIRMWFQQNLPENVYIYMRPLCTFCFKWDNLFYLLVMAFAIWQSGFPPASETSPPSVYFQWWYQRAPREGGGAGSSCRHDSPFLGKLCRVWVFGCISGNWVANEQQWMCPSWVFVASPNSLKKDWEVRERINMYHSLPCDDDHNSVSPPWMLISVIIWYQTNSNDMIQWILTGVYR